MAERTWLRDAMAKGGFSGIPTGWWHFDHGDRDHEQRELPRFAWALLRRCLRAGAA